MIGVDLYNKTGLENRGTSKTEREKYRSYEVRIYNCGCFRHALSVKLV